MCYRFIAVFLMKFSIKNHKVQRSFSTKWHIAKWLTSMSTKHVCRVQSYQKTFVTLFLTLFEFALLTWKVHIFVIAATCSIYPAHQNGKIKQKNLWHFSDIFEFALFDNKKCIFFKLPWHALSMLHIETGKLNKKFCDTFSDTFWIRAFWPWK